jgi:hypothetical protein
MFADCNLNSDSIINIANTINDVNHLIGTTDMMTGQTITEIPIDLGTIPSGSDVSSAIKQMENKGWTIYSNNEIYIDFGNLGQDYKYDNCKTVSYITKVDPDYLTTDIVDGVWTQRLDDLEDGTKMFYSCTSITEFSSDLPSLSNGYYMFRGCTALSSFNSDMSSLTNGEEMFYGCSALSSFNSDLSSLTNGEKMFYNCSKLTTFDSDLSSLTDAWYMFQNCSSLTSFNADLSSLTDGYRIFHGCKNLTTFNSDLSSLTDA